VHILVTTAGVLPPEPVADFAELMVVDGGSVTVMSVIQAPREFLEDLVTEEWRPFDDESVKVDSPDDQSEIERYISERGSRLVAPVVAALITRGIEPATVFVEADDAAASIVTVAEEIGAQTIVMGATRRLFTESAWTSVSMKVAADSKLPVLLIPAPSKRIVETNEEYEDFETFAASPEADG
jgi:nucleotide-binding universal stress UspA family protein